MITPSQAAEAERVSLAIEEGEPIEPATVTGPPPVGNPILDALDLLHQTYPSERVDIWASRVGDKPIRFTAMVEATSLPAEPVYEVWAESPMDAAEKLIAKAGSRNPSDRIRKRLAELQQEMERLNAEAKEVT